MATLGQWVKRERTQRRWKQKDLALKSDIAQSYLSKIETEQAGRVSVDIMRSLAGAFGISLERALKDSGWQDEEELVSKLLEIGTPEAELNEIQRMWPQLPQPMRAALLASVRAFVANSQPTEKGTETETHDEPTSLPVSREISPSHFVPPRPDFPEYNEEELQRRAVS